MVNRCPVVGVTVVCRGLTTDQCSLVCPLERINRRYVRCGACTPMCIVAGCTIGGRMAMLCPVVYSAQIGLQWKHVQGTSRRVQGVWVHCRQCFFSHLATTWAHTLRVHTSLCVDRQISKLEHICRHFGWCQFCSVRFSSVRLPAWLVNSNCDATHQNRLRRVIYCHASHLLHVVCVLREWPEPLSAAPPPIGLPQSAIGRNGGLLHLWCGT